LAGKCPKCGSKALKSFLYPVDVLFHGRPEVITVRLYKCIKCGWVSRWEDTI